MLSLTLGLCLVAFASFYPRSVYALVGMVLTMVVVVAMADAVAVTAMVAVMGAVVCLVDGNGMAPASPSYLMGRAYADDTVVTDEDRAMAIVGTYNARHEALLIEADRLLDCVSRAKASRHRARADAYWNRYVATLREIEISG